MAEESRSSRRRSRSRRQQQSVFTTSSANASDQAPDSNNNPSASSTTTATAWILLNGASSSSEGAGGRSYVLRGNGNNAFIIVQPSRAGAGETATAAQQPEGEVGGEGTAEGNDILNEDENSRGRTLEFLEAKDCCEVVYGWIFIILNLALTCLLICLHVHLLFYAPHTHGWNALTKLYGIDTQPNSDDCRRPSDEDTAAGAGNICPFPNSRVEQCISEVYFAQGVALRILYYTICIVSILSLIGFLVSKNKESDAVGIVELFVGLSFIVSCCYLPIVATRLGVELVGLKGNMALDSDWSPPNLISELWSETQRNGNCCGIDGFGHWKVPIPMWTRPANDSPAHPVSPSQSSYSYPLSCCNPKKSTCNETSIVTPCHVWKRGCYEGEYTMIAKYGVVIVGFIIMQLIFSVYGIWLINGIRARINSRRVLQLSFEQLQLTPSATHSSVTGNRRLPPSAESSGRHNQVAGDSSGGDSQRDGDSPHDYTPDSGGAGRSRGMDKGVGDTDPEMGLAEPDFQKDKPLPGVGTPRVPGSPIVF